MASQRDIFLQSEADAWYLRNREALAAPGRAGADPVLRLLAQEQLRPRTVLEIGCADGWRLRALAEAGAADCVGIEPSRQAMADGNIHALYLDDVRIRRGHAANLAAALAPRPFDLVILAFVLHWLSPADCKALLAQLAGYLAPAGHVAVADFLPDRPGRVAYAHCPGVWTYKADYGERLAAQLDLERVVRRCFDHADAAMAWREPEQVPNYSRCAVWLLRGKERPT